MKNWLYGLSNEEKEFMEAALRVGYYNLADNNAKQYYNQLHRKMCDAQKHTKSMRTKEEVLKTLDSMKIKGNHSGESSNGLEIALAIIAIILAIIFYIK